MNVEELINRIKARPCMYIGELNFDYLFHFINGFLYNNFSAQKADNVDNAFNYEFHDWVREWIQKNKKIQFDVERDYHFYIQRVCERQQECISLFWMLCDIFFKELHDKT